MRAKETGVHVVHHAGAIKYVGKTGKPEHAIRNAVASGIPGDRSERQAHIPKAWVEGRATSLCDLAGVSWAAALDRTDLYDEISSRSDCQDLRAR